MSKNKVQTLSIHLETIKKAFECVEISCTSNTTNSVCTLKEQFTKFIQDMCHTVQNKQQTENQLEIQEFVKEWNRQRKWLLNQVGNVL